MERAELARRLGVEPRVEEAAVVPTAIITERPATFMSSFASAVAGGGAVVLGDPHWGRREQTVLTDVVASVGASDSAALRRGWLLVPTGGTSGGVRFARHDEETIGAAVRGFCAHFGFQRVNAVGVLPLYHVSGLMAWMRTVWSGGEYVPWSWTELKAGGRPDLPAGETWTISLVPTQLQRLIELPDAVAWLRQFALVFVGGGPIWPALADAAAAARIPLSLSYGMTETAAMVTALRPEEFLAGARSSGRALPHAEVSVTESGLVRVTGESVFRGYWPEWRDAREFTTEDLGALDAQGHLTLLGRRDAVIITGGKKVQPTEVEAALLASGEFSDVAVLGVPDAEWGEAVVACYPQEKKSPDATRAVAALAPHQRPKRFVPIGDWPRNAQGKVNRAELRARVLAMI